MLFVVYPKFILFSTVGSLQGVTAACYLALIWNEMMMVVLSVQSRHGWLLPQLAVNCAVSRAGI